MHGLDEVRSTSSFKALEATLAEQSTPIVAVVGAGMSAPAGLAGWSTLKGLLVDALRDKVRLGDSERVKKLRLDADSHSRETDFWASFDSLRHSLGPAEYRGVIRDALSKGDDATIPDGYLHLWRLPIRGILSLNLDSLAQRAYSVTHPGATLKDFYGPRVARMTRFVHSQHHFLYQLHGRVDDYQSWVFTRSDLKRLYADQDYETFLQQVFSTCTVLFLGVTADDVAIGSPLTELAKRDIESHTHYWITDRTDWAAETWAADCGVRMIRYTEGQHSQVPDLLRILSTASPEEVDGPPVLIRGIESVTKLPPERELMTLPRENLRSLLNSYASSLVEQEDGMAEFEHFLDEYEEAVDRSWFIPRNAEGERLFGYTLQSSSLAGAFGRVYPAIDVDGNLCALKLLRREIRYNLPLLRSYRRGVQAMRILADREISGMVAYRDASEIPAFVTMEWVDGPNLAEAKDSRLLEEWQDILWVAHELCGIIREAHALPERVLHRDLRPANVMLRNGWNPKPDWEVVVLDFDLSTYKGAAEKSVLAEQSVLGYLAPEQIDSKAEYSSRSALVDSFGLGMTLYFLCGGLEPQANFGMSADFERRVRLATKTPPESIWVSTPRRIERLIVSATKKQQNMRPDISQMRYEIGRVLEALDDPVAVKDGDLICEEVACRSNVLADKYDWNEATDTARRDTVNGMSIALEGPLEGENLTLQIDWSARGTERYADLRSTPEKAARAAAWLRKAGWRVVKTSGTGQGVLEIRAQIPLADVVLDISRAAASVDSAVQVASLD